MVQGSTLQLLLTLTSIQNTKSVLPEELTALYQQGIVNPSSGPVLPTILKKIPPPQIYPLCDSYAYWTCIPDEMKQWLPSLPLPH